MRCSSPQVTTCSTASNTLSQEVRKQSAVSFHERRRAQRARKSIYTLVKVRLPSPQGTSSTATTPQRRQSTRRITYRRKTKNPHRWMNSKRRSASWSYPGAGKMAPRADCGRTFARSQGHFDASLVATETGVLIDKTSETMAAVQDRGQFHGGETSTINRRQTQAHDLVNLRRPWG